MGLRFQNYDEIYFSIINQDLAAGDVIIQRPFFNCQVEALVVTLRTVVNANNLDLKLTDATNDLTAEGNLISTDAVGKRIVLGGNLNPILAGGALTLEITENGAVATAAADLLLILRKTEYGRPVDWAGAT